MGFNGGGGGQLSNHEHDGSVALDGGPLDFKNITQSSMSAGSLSFSDGNHLQELVKPAVPANEILTFETAGTAPTWVTDPFLTSGKLEKLGEHSVATEETSFVFTPASPIDMSDYAALVCYYTYDVAYSGVIAFDWGLQIDNSATGNYHYLGYTQNATTLTGFQTVGGTYFPITDTNQNVNGSPKNYGMFILTADAAGTYYNINSWSNGWTRNTRTMFGEKVAALGDISTLDFDSTSADGIFNSLFQFYGVKR
jgi:hypothetical protein